MSRPAQQTYSGYGHREMAATTVRARFEDPRWRWLFPVTRSTREFVTAQMPVLYLSYALAIGQIYLAARVQGGVPTSTRMGWWLAESVISIAVRSLLYIPVIRASPIEVAAKPYLRLAPLIAVLLGAAHWSWTATIFVGTSLDLVTVVVILTFVMLTVACIAIAPASPAACAVYLVALWPTLAYKLANSDWATALVLTVLGVAVAGTLWFSFHTTIGGVRRYLVRSDEVDLLVDQLRERNSEVEAMRNAATREYATRSAFFSSASHDFRQRVHAMKLLAHSSLSEASMRPGAGSAVARLAAVVEDLETYMSDVLEFARLESATLEPRREMHRLQEIFQKIDVQFEDVAAAARIDLSVRATPLAVRSDSAMLVRILENLVSNAIKFSRGRVLLSARRRPDGIQIDVRDQGPGIPSDYVGVVFDAFYQAPGTPGQTPQGVGLGLAIVKRLADALGYRVEVHSRPGRGTLMRLVIPSVDVLELPNFP
jgi:signal transduction histidine kinase